MAALYLRRSKSTLRFWSKTDGTCVWIFFSRGLQADGVDGHVYSHLNLLTGFSAYACVGLTGDKAKKRLVQVVSVSIPQRTSLLGFNSTFLF
jgi:hypothetical protein